MEPRGVSGSSVNEDNQVNSHPSSSSSNEVVVSSTPVEQRSAAVEAQPLDTPSTTTAGRIPSRVFASTSTNSVAEWSVTSNESLFSIPIGNMSFNDNLSCISKSEELDPVTISSPLFEFPVYNLSTPTENNKEAGCLKSGDNEDGHGSVNDVAVKTMREVLRENESEKKNDVDEDGYTNSFAFPILRAEAGTKNKNQSSSQHPTPTTPQHTPPETPKPLRVPESPKAETPKATQNGSSKRWFSCCSCFPSCS